MKNTFNQNQLLNQEFDLELTKRLVSGGIASNKIPEFLGDVIQMINSNAKLGLKGINHHLQKTVWKGMIIDHSLFI
ncbi:MAG: hypothetical protein OMM_07676 [Candidatus Magnetoglobus multicellularis str. Araruama]|uniref:Uncharacterized protein n=1 Tax=Candidatus Magnetoglobus multicellularis str. Araruama TaxID=890399 RepID=A0A1V1PB73_9BACT|nr:MAG: hypothetical protein OMM_07676 [Candidatus Magnetoglobus multicellularis str. Araruama]